jgi:hypothetical protein
MNLTSMENNCNIKSKAIVVDDIFKRNKRTTTIENNANNYKKVISFLD